MKPIPMLLGAVTAGLATLALPTITVLAQTSAPAPPAPQLRTLGPGELFTLFFVMLGPFKLLGPFVKMTRGMDEAACRRLAARGFGIACIAGLVAASIGRIILVNWGISLPALLAAAGLVLLLVALQAILSQYEATPTPPVDTSGPPPAERPQSANPAPGLALSLAFPHIITPYGAAALILLLTAASDPARHGTLLGLFLVVMVLDLVAMWFARPILRFGANVLAIVGSVLGVLQVALAIQLLMAAGRLMGILPPLGG
jgi:multiple antibiotic resistance protein